MVASSFSTSSGTAATGRPYMMAENVCYYRQYLLVQNMIDGGLFGGSFTYGECGYVHDCRSLLFNPDDTGGFPVFAPVNSQFCQAWSRRIHRSTTHRGNLVCRSWSSEAGEST